MPNEMPEMKPCPFCGSAAVVGGEPDGAWPGFYVACSAADCRCCVGEGYDRDACPDHSFATEEEAIAAWNTRSDLAPKVTEGEVRQLAEFVVDAVDCGYIGQLTSAGVTMLRSLARRILNGGKANQTPKEKP